MRAVREYINLHIKKALPASSELDSAFNFASLPVGKLNKKFHLEFGDISPVDNQSGGFLTDEVAVTIRLFERTKSATTADFDQAIDVAHEIRREMVDCKNFKNTKIARVAPQVWAVRESDRNNEIMETTISFIFEVSQ